MGGDPGSATCVTKNTHFTNRICHPKSSPQFPELYSEILFRNPIPKSYSEILFQKPQSLGFRHRNGGGPTIGHLRNKKHTFYEKNLSSQIQPSIPRTLFRNPIPKSYSEILFRNPIPEILFRNPIPKSYSEILFRNPSLQDLGTGMGGDPGSATCVTKNTHFTNRICHPKSSPQFPNSIPKSYSEILFRNPIPKSYSEILFRNPIPKSYSEILFRNPIPKSYSEILFRNPIPKPQSLGFRHRNGGGPRIGHLRNKKHTFYEQNLSSKIQSSIPRTLFRNPIPKSYSEILFRNPIPKSYSQILFPKSYSEILFRNPIPKSYSETLVFRIQAPEWGGTQDRPPA